MYSWLTASPLGDLQEKQAEWLEVLSFGKPLIARSVCAERLCNVWVTTAKDVKENFKKKTDQSNLSPLIFHLSLIFLSHARNEVANKMALNVSFCNIKAEKHQLVLEHTS